MGYLFLCVFFELIYGFIFSLLFFVQILGKCEFLNPGGSVKDRVAVKIIEEVNYFTALVSNQTNHVIFKA